LCVTAQTKNYPHKGTEDTALGTVLKADHNSFAIIQVKNDKTNHRWLEYSRWYKATSLAKKTVHHDTIFRFFSHISIA